MMNVMVYSLWLEVSDKQILYSSLPYLFFLYMEALNHRLNIAANTWNPGIGVKTSPRDIKFSVSFSCMIAHLFAKLIQILVNKLKSALDTFS